MVLCRFLPIAVVLFFSANGVTDSFASTALTPVPEAVRAPDKKINNANTPLDSGAFLAGIAARSKGDDAEAARNFRIVSAANPTNKGLATQAFILSVLAGSPEAAELARKEEQSGEKGIIASFVLGNAAALKGDWQTAERYYRQAEKDPIVRLVVPVLLAWCEQARHQTDQAINSLTHSQENILAPFYTLHAALIAQVSGKTAEAGRLFTQSQHLMQGEDLLLARSFAAWYWQQGQRDKARDVLRSALASDPVLALSGKQLQAEISNFPVQSPLQGLACVYIMAAALFQQQIHGIDEAGESTHSASQLRYRLNEVTRLMLSFALELDPHMAEALFMMAEVQDGEGHSQVARRMLSRIPPQSPLAPVAAFKLALIDNATDHLDEAREKLLPLVQQNPNLILPVSELGNTEAGRKNWQGAFAAYDKAVKLSKAGASLPGMHKDYWSLLFLRAVASYQLGHWEQTKADLNEALILQPDNPLLLNFLGYSMTERHENLPEAERLLRRAALLAPHDASIRDSLGWIIAERGNLKEGTQILEQTAEKTPEDPEVNYHLGEVYWRAGRHREAIDHWNIALGLKPEPRDEALIKAALARADALPAAKTNNASQSHPAPATSDK